MRLYRNRAAEFEELADKALVPTGQRRYRTIARHYRELADRAELAGIGANLEPFAQAWSGSVVTDDAYVTRPASQRLD